MVLFFQLVSELIVLAIRPEDDGTFFCAAQNPAGVARANFTVRVVDSLENSGGGRTSGGLQENTDLYNSPDAANADEMFKVCTCSFPLFLSLHSRKPFSAFFQFYGCQNSGIWNIYTFRYGMSEYTNR